MPEPAGAAFRQCWSVPEWVLLDKTGHIGRRNDATTARTMTKEHGAIEVSFALAEPPALSRCVVHFPDLTAAAADDAIIETCVTGAGGAFLLIAASFREPGGDYAVTDFFLYKAGPVAPSLHLVPEPYLMGIHSIHVAVLPCGDHHCLVVVPQPRLIEASGRWGYDLHIFSTKTMTSWSTKAARTARDMDSGCHVFFEHDKVFAVGGDALAWAHLRHGILMCQGITGDEPVMRLIRLPPPMPINDDTVNPDRSLPPLDVVRDVTIRDGSFRFVEMESHYLHNNRIKSTPLRWTINTYKKMTGSENWEMQCPSLDSANLTPASSCIPCLFPEIWDSRESKLTLNKMISFFPTLDQYHDNVVYMISMLPGHHDPHGYWVLALDTKGCKLEKAVPFSAEPFFTRAFLQCAFSKYLSCAPVSRDTGSSVR